MTTRFDWMQGCATALVTPFRKDGSIDDECFRRSVERQIKAGVRIVVPCGTTGESATMDDGERLHVIRMAVEAARGKTARVVAGTGSNNTASTIELTRRAREAGADAALIVAPYYNKPTQEGMFAHFSEIARSLKGFPLMLYNVPSRTASNVSAETTLRLAEKHENIVATKEASGDHSQVMEIIRARPRYFRVFAGDDAAALPLTCGKGACRGPYCCEEAALSPAAPDGGEFHRDVAGAVQVHNEGNGPFGRESAPAVSPGGAGNASQAEEGYKGNEYLGGCYEILILSGPGIDPDTGHGHGAGGGGGCLTIEGSSRGFLDVDEVGRCLKPGRRKFAWGDIL
jgi:4-hydroxy-tetrahydrodipicolinate synthase